jgi:transcriptional regulator with XRE-family HTH domain
VTTVRYTPEEKRERMRKVAWWRNHEKCSLAEVGKRLGMSVSQARNWEKRAIAAGFYGAEERRRFFSTRVRGV